MTTMTDARAVEVLERIRLGVEMDQHYLDDGLDRMDAIDHAIASLREPAGEVAVTRNEAGAIVAVTRQDAEGRILSVIAEAQAQGGGDHVAELREIRAAYHEIAPCGFTVEKAALDAAIAALTAPPSAPGVSEHVRRLVGKLDQWRACMSYNESYFGEQAGLVKEVATGLARAVDPIYPPKPEPTDPLDGVVIHSAAVPFSGAPNPPTARDLAYAEARASIPSAPVGVEDAVTRMCETYYGVQFNYSKGARDKMRRLLDAALAQQPAARRQYFYKVNECPAEGSQSPDCICWHDEGTGPLADGPAPTWRNAPDQQPAAVDGAALTDAAIVAGWEAKAKVHEADDTFEGALKAWQLRDCANELRSRAVLAAQPGGAK